MAIGRKSSRRIVVDGTTYRWRLRRQPTYDQALCDRPCTYAVQYAEDPGTTFVVTTNQPHTSNWSGSPAVAVLPRDATAAMASALCPGWSPTQPGPAFHLEQPGG